MLSRALRVCVLTMGCLGFAAVAHADTITVNNPSFEVLPSGVSLTPCVGPGCFFDFGSIPDWTTTGSVGQFQPGTQDGNFGYLDSLTDGITVAFTNTNPNGGLSTISQTVGATVQTGVTYTLQVDLGQRNDQAFDGTAELILSGSGGTMTVLCIGPLPTKGNWSTCTAAFTGSASDAGDSITIQLASSGDQGDFDNVRLSDNLHSTPEPSGLLLLGSGLIGLAGFAKRRIA